MTEQNTPPEQAATTTAPADADVKLDEALEETFPSSDPIAVTITREERPPER
nr:hypothetical protein [uncultured Duganella sp.]